MVCPELHFNLSKQMHSHKCYMLHLYFPSPNSLQIGHYHFTEHSQDASSADISDFLFSALRLCCGPYSWLDKTPSAAHLMLSSAHPFPSKLDEFVCHRCNEYSRAAECSRAGEQQRATGNMGLGCRSHQLGCAALVEPGAAGTSCCWPLHYQTTQFSLPDVQKLREEKAESNACMVYLKAPSSTVVSLEIKVSKMVSLPGHFVNSQVPFGSVERGAFCRHEGAFCSQGQAVRLPNHLHLSDW